VPSRVFHIHGWQNTLGFKLTDPIGNFKNYWDLFMVIQLTKNTIKEHQLWIGDRPLWVQAVQKRHSSLEKGDC